MLITTCTHCLARFRVTPQQLNEKQGQVRCGRCHRVFSGFEALERVPDDDVVRPSEANEPPGDDSPPTLGPLEEPAQAAEAPFEPMVEPSGAHEPPTRPPDAVMPDAVEPPSEYVTQPLEPAAPVAPETARSQVPPARAVSPPPVEPASTTPSRPLPPRPRTAPTRLSLEPPVRKRLSRGWAVGCVLLLLVLAAELVYGFRAPLAQQYPVTRPWLQAACARLGCTVAWPREDGLLKLEDSELLEVPGKADEIALAARIRNLATFAQEFPHIELTLTDNTGQAAARRVLRPMDYLGRALGPGEALAAGADVAIQLRIETPHLHATGYELLLFYP
ncbi:MAG TPA: DUF3426 domain-containing protein [Usitatibacter sp.]|nr:DUF3426 domain-containing protein [Usitatibacter sp.]